MRTIRCSGRYTGVPAHGGCLPRGVSAQGGVSAQLLGGGGRCLPGGTPWTEWQRRVADGKNRKNSYVILLHLDHVQPRGDPPHAGRVLRRTRRENQTNRGVLPAVVWSPTIVSTCPSVLSHTQQIPDSSPTNACSQVHKLEWLGCHAGNQEVSRCHTKGEFEDFVARM